MQKLIDADVLDNALTKLRFNADGELAHWGDRKDWCLHGSEIEKLIADAPTVDAVEVVRCKDCKRCDITDYGAGEVLECIRDRLYRINSISLEGETYFRKVKPDDFCSWAERREDGQTD